VIAPLQVIAHIAALRFFDSLVEGILIGIFAALVLHFSRRQNAATRFAICFSALIAIALLPFAARSSPDSVSASSHAAFTLPESWALYLFLLWAAIASWFLIGFGRAIAHVHALRKNCVPVNEQALDPLLQETLRRHRTNRRIAFCTSDQVAVPTALGLLKPAIVIPQWVMAELSPTELNQILLHELAHLRRWDDWTNLAQQFVRAIFFFHPAIWWIEKQVALEREMACDDAVLEETASPRAYAECLAHLAEKSFVRRSLALAQAALGKVRQTSLRVAQILNQERSTSANRGWKAASLVAGFAIACTVGLSKAPTLVAFQDNDSNSVIKLASVPSSDSAEVESRAPAVTAKMKNPSVSSLPVIQAKLRAPIHQRTPQPSTVAVTVRSVKSKPAIAEMVHNAGMKTSVAPVTETVLFVIQSGDQAGQPVYQIQMWRVTIFHPAVDPAGKAPQKQI